MHQAWDSGAIADSFADILGDDVRSIIATKTTKTKCGRRVSIDQIANGHSTCAACLAELQSEAEGLLMCRGYERAVEEFGFEYANSLTWDELIAAVTL